MFRGVLVTLETASDCVLTKMASSGTIRPRPASADTSTTYKQILIMSLCHKIKLTHACMTYILIVCFNG